MEITDEFKKKIKGMARKVANNQTDYEDCVQEGLVKILESESGHSTGYYMIRAKGSMLRFLEKEYYKGCVPYSNKKYVHKKGRVPAPEFIPLEDIDK